MHRTSILDSRASLQFMLCGNKLHVEMLKRLGLSPAKRYEDIKNGKVDVVFVYCSDARGIALDHEIDSYTSLHLRVAGNTVPKSGSFRDEIDNAVSCLKDEGMLVVVSHTCCGAMGEYVKWDGSDTGSKSLNALLGALSGSSPTENGLEQMMRATSLPNMRRRCAGALFYDWVGDGMAIVSGNPPAQLQLLVDRINTKHRDQMQDVVLKEGLSKQTPHAIVVGANDLPFSVPTILGAKQNEVFCATGFGNGMDEMNIASVLYAIEHLNQQHIAFVAPKEDRTKIQEMFDRWQADLVAESVIARRIESGHITASRLRYSLQTGQLCEL